MTTLRVFTLQGCPHATAWQRQQAAMDELRKDPCAEEILFCVEHTPVLTLGRNHDPAHLLMDAEDLRKCGLEVVSVRRGGDITWHGPGQWTLYPILRLDRRGRDLKRHLRNLEETVLLWLAGHGLPGRREPDHSGTWVGRDKIAAVGVGVRHWLSCHGIAVNIHCDLSTMREAIVPCGIPAHDGGVTSLAELTGRTHDMQTERRALVDAFTRVHGVSAVMD